MLAGSAMGGGRMGGGMNEQQMMQEQMVLDQEQMALNQQRMMVNQQYPNQIGYNQQYPNQYGYNQMSRDISGEEKPNQAGGATGGLDQTADKSHPPQIPNQQYPQHMPNQMYPQMGYMNQGPIGLVANGVTRILRHVSWLSIFPFLTK